MKDRVVAERYAQEHGLTFFPKGSLDFAAPSLGGGRSCINAIRGAVGGGPPGILCRRAGTRGPGPPSALYEIPGLGDVIQGLWVRRSGRSIWTRVALPRGYTELMLPSEAFNARYRVGVSADRDEEVARRLLTGDFLSWLADLGLQGSRLAVGTSFEIWQGVLFIRGPGDAFKSTEKLEAFATAAARIATEVVALTNSPGS